MPKTSRRRSGRFYRSSRGFGTRASYARKRAGKSRRTRFASNRRRVTAKTVRNIVKRQIRSNIEYHKQYFYSYNHEINPFGGIASTTGTFDTSGTLMDTFYLQDITPVPDYRDAQNSINFNIWRNENPSDSRPNVWYPGTDDNKLLLTHFDIKILMQGNDYNSIDPQAYWRVQILRAKVKGTDFAVSRNEYFRHWHAIDFSGNDENLTDTIHAVQHKNPFFDVVRDTRFRLCRYTQSLQNSTTNDDHVDSIAQLKPVTLNYRIPLNKICRRPNVTTSGYYISEGGTSTSSSLPTFFPEMYRYYIAIIYTGQYGNSPDFSYTCSYGWKNI